MQKKLYVIDTTLRDGEQSAGVSFSLKEKLKIAFALDNLGVDIIEAGIPIMGINEQKTITALLDMGLKASVLTWNRMSVKDVQASVETGVRDIHISVPSSDLHIQGKLKMTREELVKEYLFVLEFALSRGLTVSIGAEDASRADEDFLAKLFSLGISRGVKRIRYADTVSVLSPFTSYDRISTLIQKLCRNLELSREVLLDGIQIDFHGHNDLGLGTGNALGAFKAGADTISCSVNGLGERAGNTALEEIVLALMLIEGVSSSVNIKKLMEVSKIVENFSGRQLHKSKPIVGELVFSHEAGIHVDGLLKDPQIYTYVDPKWFGREHSIVYGKHSGKSYARYTNINR